MVNLSAPPFLNLESQDAYLAYYVNNYCCGPLYTHEGTPVYFRRDRFFHAFFESTLDSCKNEFSLNRATRMDWIRVALEDTSVVRYQGWDKKKKKYTPASMVVLTIGNFIIVLRMRLTENDVLQGDFVTCYWGDRRRTLDKIKQGPRWVERFCIDFLKKEGR